MADIFTYAKDWASRAKPKVPQAREGLGLAVPGATAGYATSVHAVNVDPASPPKKDFD